jgi:hypothetical protein
MSKNILDEMKRLALQSTAQYVIDNMYNVMPVKTLKEVHVKAIEHALEDGLVLEFGVYSGETINHIANHMRSRKVHGFDSFEGLPEAWIAGYDKGRFKTNPPKVLDNVELHIGWFEDSIPKFLETHNEKIAYLHIDCDLYSSTKTIFDKMGHLIKVGTVIVFDEYFNYPGWENGEYKAFKEFINKNKLSYEYLTYNSVSEQVAVKITG